MRSRPWPASTTPASNVGYSPHLVGRRRPLDEVARKARAPPPQPANSVSFGSGPDLPAYPDREGPEHERHVVHVRRAATPASPRNVPAVVSLEVAWGYSPAVEEREQTEPLGSLDHDPIDPPPGSAPARRSTSRT